MTYSQDFKATEIGLVPTDWEVCAFYKVVLPVSGQVDPRNPPYCDMPLIAPDHIESASGKIIAIVDAKAQSAKSGKYPFQKGDVLYSKIRPYLQKVALPQFDGSCSADMYALRPKEGISSEFVLYTLLDKRFTEFAISVSARSGIPKINRNELSQFSLAVPPADEQVAIASALKDIDDLIASLDALIAKKRDIKQAAMQQLLTGKTRLPGFKREWVAKRLATLGTFFKGSGVRRDQALSGDIPCVRYGEIYTDHKDMVRQFKSFISAEVAAEATPLQNGDLLFAGSGETKEEIGKCVAFVGEHPAFAGGDIIILRPNWGSPVFLGYLMNAADVARQKANRGQGDAVVHISAGALGAISVLMPEPAEQAAIAEVLTAMDEEIEALNNKRAKMVELKGGMMQQLLTGRIRLV
ncbi:restriction endonuclease subunit S [Gluconobacter cerinus]|uniref:restriction endonuclease subunit S n=1 Tax=Gluconobacter cerinus TaxID=38307 RepID=UPI001B8C67ED|nr:restriction endonuclease subunit S [Gluconobacter cerinus]MBS1021257.1 restriction endonuclease subunit S [Gluconobacter cerinus]